MKYEVAQNTKANLESFKFEALDKNQMSEVRGGGRPRSQDRDMFDLEEDE